MTDELGFHTLLTEAGRRRALLDLEAAETAIQAWRAAAAKADTQRARIKASMGMDGALARMERAQRHLDALAARTPL